MEKKELFSKLRVLNLNTRKNVNKYIVGAARSNVKGSGMSFSEVREYHFGDEVRTIDWNVTARYNTPHVKIFEEEKERHFLVILDASSSNWFENDTVSKWEKQIEVAAMICFSAWKQNDHFALLIFSDKIEEYIPYGKGSKHFYRIIDKLITYEPKVTRTRLNIPLEWLSEEKLPRSTIFFASDFLAELDALINIHSVVFRHNLYFLCVRDEEEGNLPDIGWVQFENFESSRKTWINTSNKNAKLTYERFFVNQDLALDQISKKNGVLWKKLSLKDNTYQLLNSFFK